MKILIVALLFIFTLQNNDKYVCLPCGHECDKEVHSSSGKCSSCGMELVKASSIKFKNIDLHELCNRLKANPQAILLDVRSPSEFNGSSQDVPSFGHFKNAINMNVEELEKRVSELSNYKNSEVIVYCSRNHRSPVASYFLGKQGFTKVKNMLGGVSTFTESNLHCLEKEFVFHTK